jgi:hypothetical protein
LPGLTTRFKFAWSKNWRRLAALALGLLVSVPAAAVVVKHSGRGGVSHVMSCGRSGDSLFEADDWLSQKLVPSAQEEAWCDQNGKRVYDVRYRTDEFGRRVTPQTAEAAYDSFALFAGCSNTFGQGVNDDETLPARFAQHVAGRKIKVYNYGVPSWGPANFLALLTDPRFAPGIKERRGFLVYTFIDHHVDRAIGRLNWLRTTTVPCYQAAANGGLERCGLMDADHPPLHNYPLGEFNVRKKFTLKKLDWPAEIRAADIELTARMFEEACRAFKRQFESTGFFVLAYPNAGLHLQMKYYFMKDDCGVKVLDYSALYRGTPDRNSFEFPDGHPRPNAYQDLADRLYGELSNMGVF